MQSAAFSKWKQGPFGIKASNGFWITRSCQTKQTCKHMWHWNQKTFNNIENYSSISCNLSLPSVQTYNLPNEPWSSNSQQSWNITFSSNQGLYSWNIFTGKCKHSFIMWWLWLFFRIFLLSFLCTSACWQLHLHPFLVKIKRKREKRRWNLKQSDKQRIKEYQT